MFYSDNILARKGPLANIWLAAHWDRRLSKAQIVHTDIETSVRDIVGGALPPMALRLSGQLLLGVTKIYSRKARYLLEDCSDALARLKITFKKANVDLPPHASKASHTAITMPTAVNMEDALAPEPELDLEALLKESAEAEEGNSYHHQSKPFGQTNNNNRRLFAHNDYESTKLDIELPMAKDSELPASEFLDLDYNSRVGAANGMDINPSRQSIEVGRRAVESPRQSLPFSPLRTPTKNVDFEQIPLNDDYGYLDEPNLLPNSVEKSRASDQHLGIDMDIDNVLNRQVATKRQPTKSATARNATTTTSSRRKPLPLDEETEIPNAIYQEHIHDTFSTLLKEPSLMETNLAEFIKQFTFDERPATRNAQKRDNSIIEPLAEQVPLNDDDYVLGPEDYALEAMDAAIMHSPKSPRIMSPTFNDENAVPEVNQSNPGTPSKTRLRDTLAVSLAEDTIDTLTVWQQTLSLNKPVHFESLIMSPANRKNAADTFLQVLVLHTKGFVKAEQLAPYGTINVIAKDSLFTPSPQQFIPSNTAVVL